MPTFCGTSTGAPCGRRPCSRRRCASSRASGCRCSTEGPGLSPEARSTDDGVSRPFPEPTLRRAHLQRRLVLYSGGQDPRNALIHESLLELAMRGRRRERRGRGLRMTYVPYTADGALPFLRRFERRYRAFGARHFGWVPADAPELAQRGPARRRLIEGLAASDIVYLAGGNTFEFLHNLRRSGLLDVLRAFHARGGVLAGLSAGAHLLTPHIALAGHPPFDRDPNDVGLPAARQAALGLVDFDFFPHYRHSARYRGALSEWTERSGRPLYAARDGGGLVIEGDCFTVHGDVWLFDQGLVSRLGG